MNERLFAAAAGAAALVLAGCAARSNTYNRGALAGVEHAAPHSERVCLIRGPLPIDVQHQVLGEIRGNKRWYGSASEVLDVMANEARSIGADAIVNLKTSFQTSPLAWSRPVGSGYGVKFSDRNAVDCQKLGGEWR